MVLNFALVILGIAMLVLGGDKLVEGATHIGKRFGMSDRVAGLTICAVGTSMPEVFVSVTSTLSGKMCIRDSPMSVARKRRAMRL